MPVSAEVLRRLMAAGVTGDALIGIVEAIDADMETVAVAKPRSAGAVRQERYRARHAAQNVTNDVTCDVTERDADGSPVPPKNYPKKTNSAPGREARIDPDWEPSSADVEAVTKRGMSPDQIKIEAQSFIEYHLGYGTLSDDFGMLFRGWIRNGQLYARPGKINLKKSYSGTKPNSVRHPPSTDPPPPDDGPRVDTPSGRMSVAHLLAQHRAGRWLKVYGPPPTDPRCVIAAYLPKTPALEPAE